MTVRYTIEAKPTFYNGVQFRSRLEARWAALFDLADWKWSYEPIDFGPWSPDFMLQWKPSSGEMFVEVKPITKFDVETAKKIADTPAPVVMLCGLNNTHTWLNKHGHWENYYLMVHLDEEWKQAGDIVQWHHS